MRETAICYDSETGGENKEASADVSLHISFLLLCECCTFLQLIVRMSEISERTTDAKVSSVKVKDSCDLQHCLVTQESGKLK